MVQKVTNYRAPVETYRELRTHIEITKEYLLNIIEMGINIESVTAKVEDIPLEIMVEYCQDNGLSVSAPSLDGVVCAAIEDHRIKIILRSERHEIKLEKIV